MSVALVTNYLPPYRLPLYELLAERYGVEVHCFGGKAGYVPASLRDLDRQISEARFPAHRLARQSDAARLGEANDAVIAGVAGRVALPSAYRGARKANVPFVLWASLWRHPVTIAHMLSLSLMRRIYKRADAVVTYGSHVSRYVARHRKGDHEVFVAPQAVEPDLFGRPVTALEKAAWRVEVGIPERARVVLFVGRLVHEKGVDVLLRAWRRLTAGKVAEGRLGAGEDAALCFVGDGPLASRAAAAGDSVFVAGRMDRADLPVAYASAEMLVVPSIETRSFLEPWGLVCNEAMYQSRPVIASSAVGAVPGTLVTHGGSGLVVRQGDERELASAIARLLDDHPLRERLGRQARAAVEPYTYEAAADAFGEALAGARAAHAGDGKA
jgi:glycosyltransferase involved in cell wall biosynthesis